MKKKLRNQLNKFECLAFDFFISIQVMIYILQVNGIINLEKNIYTIIHKLLCNNSVFIKHIYEYIYIVVHMLVRKLYQREFSQITLTNLFMKHIN